jgi:small-conductance mechanosensitive channel
MRIVVLVAALIAAAAFAFVGASLVGLPPVLTTALVLGLGVFGYAITRSGKS